MTALFIAGAEPLRFFLGAEGLPLIQVQLVWATSHQSLKIGMRDLSVVCGTWCDCRSSKFLDELIKALRFDFEFTRPPPKAAQLPRAWSHRQKFVQFLTQVEYNGVGRSGGGSD